MSNVSSPASFKGHPLHPVLVAFPIGLFIFSLACDVAGILRPGNPNWAVVALYSMVGGIIGALLAAVPGLIDLLALAEPNVKRIGIYHMSINLVVVALFVVDAWLRFGGTSGVLPLALSIAGVLLLFLSGWLGGEMVYVHGVAVGPLIDTPAEMRAKDRIHGSTPRPAR